MIIVLCLQICNFPKSERACFLLFRSPTPIAVEPLEQKDEEDGNPERYINKNREYQREREQQPRFAQPGSFEYEWGQRLKAIEEEERMKREQLEKNIEVSRAKMQDEMDIAKTEHQTMVMRQGRLISGFRIGVSLCDHMIVVLQQAITIQYFLSRPTLIT